jgi:thiosulfate reductase cytochrome b subunit
MPTKVAGSRTTRRLGHWFGWLALAFLALALLTGYGITQFRVVDPLTFGMVGKAVAQRWHETVALLIVVFLALHVSIALWWRLRGGSTQ